jgi:hypothetical protein
MDGHEGGHGGHSKWVRLTAATIRALESVTASDTSAEFRAQNDEARINGLQQSVLRSGYFSLLKDKF